MFSATIKRKASENACDIIVVLFTWVTRSERLTCTRSSDTRKLLMVVQNKYIRSSERDTTARKTPACDEIHELDEDESETSEALCQTNES